MRKMKMFLLLLIASRMQSRFGAIMISTTIIILGASLSLIQVHLERQDGEDTMDMDTVAIVERKAPKAKRAVKKVMIKTKTKRMKERTMEKMQEKEVKKAVKKMVAVVVMVDMVMEDMEAAVGDATAGTTVAVFQTDITIDMK